MECGQFVMFVVYSIRPTALYLSDEIGDKERSRCVQELISVELMLRRLGHEGRILKGYRFLSRNQRSRHPYSERLYRYITWYSVER